jgi:ribosomal protein L16 Arg81 hydroxylase
MVLQISGRKRWRLYDFPKHYPLLTETFDTIDYTPGEPSHEIILTPGDMLYVPRGLAHDARSSEDSKSVHITVGLFPPMWRDLFETRMLQLKEDVRFRRAPMGHLLPESAVEFRSQLETLLREAFGKADMEKLLEATLRQHFSRQSRITDGWLTRCLKKSSVSFTTQVRVRDNVIYQVEEDSKSVCVYFYDKRLLLPIAVGPAVHRLLSGETSTIGSLQANLAPNSSLLLAERFLDAGLVTIVD